MDGMAHIDSWLNIWSFGAETAFKEAIETRAHRIPWASTMTGARVTNVFYLTCIFGEILDVIFSLHPFIFVEPEFMR